MSDKGAKGRARKAVRLSEKKARPHGRRQDLSVVAPETELLNKRELSEVRQQQVATADVLKVISRSAFDLQVVLDTLTQSAAGLCDADHAWLYRQDGDIYRYAASMATPRRSMNESSNIWLR